MERLIFQGRIALSELPGKLLNAHLIKKTHTQKTKTSESCVQSEPFHDPKLDTGVGLGLVKFGAGSPASVSRITG